MSNVRNENLGLKSWIELFLNHWKYGHDYESSTVLTDAQYNIIAFYDRWTENIDRIELNLPFKGWFIIANWKWIDINGNIKYEPYDFEMARRFWKEEVRRLKMSSTDATNFWKTEVRPNLISYNKDYFLNLLKWINI